jgi:hypothetical protein
LQSPPWDHWLLIGRSISNRRRITQAATLIAISVQELRRLIAHLQTTRPPDMSFRWMWSIWRRLTVAAIQMAAWRFLARRSERVALRAVILQSAEHGFDGVPVAVEERRKSSSSNASPLAG